jgi:hypothetical protein
MSQSRWELLETLADEEETDSASVIRTTKKSDIEVELTRYLELTPKASSSDVDVLGWWRAQSPNLPLLAEIARKILAIPASSSSSERVFSSGGNVVTTQRMNLDPSTVERLVYIHDNYQKVTIKKWKLGPKDQEESEEDSE